ncbi:MAG: hypothetical protein OHK0053_15280 [Microscillaceae bacterium]
MYYSEFYQEKLNELFDFLKHTADPEEISQIETQIWELWSEGGHLRLNELMEEGCQALEAEQYDEAIIVFSQMIALFPDYAEGWNKRATAYFLRGNYKASLDDIAETLRLEPRHFGAISGMATIFLMIQDLKGAIKAYRLLQKIYPQRHDIDQQIEHLRKKLR